MPDKTITTKREWDVQWALSTAKGREERERLLNEGWEPIACHGESLFYSPSILFRRKHVN
jgi:hypothetical protein